MKNYKLINIIAGWVVFLIAFITYYLTAEPTSSLWDCGEFIASAFKLQVGHPPGAPLFMIMARFFSLFAQDTAHVAKMINMVSVLASAFTILFLFWTITHLAKKLFRETLSTGNALAVLGSGLVGALAYTFSDTFWFSAVEGEVYASSSLFTAVVFWAILKWENVADEKHASRWIVLIAFLMGLSIGVHLLNLLAIPAIVFVFYFRKYKLSQRGIILASIISVVLLAIVMYGIIPGIVKVASWFELRMVNSLGAPYQSGVLVYAVLLIASLILGLYFTYKGASVQLQEIFTILPIILLGIPFLSSSGFLNVLITVAIVLIIHLALKNQQVILNTILLIMTVIVIGYSSYAMIVIRSNANPPMDENNPENVFSLLSYLNREQYGDRPLVYGQYFNSPVIDSKQGSPTWTPVNGKYEITNYKPEYVYDKRFLSIFPRMYSPEQNHINAYKEWTNFKGTPIEVTRANGQKETIYKPTFGENLKFFFKYQVGFMYGRYFMWNFAGRQNDTQGHGGILKGNWISGIKFLDAARLGSQDNLPDSFKNVESRNKYYLLPLIFGLLGLMFHFQKNKKDFSIVALLFILTGLAIVVFLNQTPIQPRERDYAYAGSFYAFAIWIGFGVLAIYDLLKNKLPDHINAILVSILSILLVPGIMAKENWDDHDRSGRYTARDMAANYLESCDKNAILFTVGDNDTFPLWYAQDVENIRTDVRVCNLMLLNTDWYIDQMKRKAYESEPMPFSLEKEEYIQGTKDMIHIINQPQIIANELYEANKTLFSDRFDKLYAELIQVLESSTFVSEHPKDFQTLRDNPSGIKINTFNSLINTISREENIKKYLLNAVRVNELKNKTQDLYNAVINSYLPVKIAMQFIKNKNKPNIGTIFNEQIDYLPTNKLKIEANPEKIVSMGIVSEEKKQDIDSVIEWTISKKRLYKSELMILDLLANNDWERPVYFVSPDHDGSLGLEDYMQLEGFAYRLVPVKTEQQNALHIGSVDTEKMYERIMHTFRWGRMNEEDVYLDHYNLRNFTVMKIRNNFTRLAEEFYKEGEKEKAVEVLDKCMDLMPAEKVPYDFFILDFIQLYYQLSENSKADEIAAGYFETASDEVRYYLSLRENFAASVSDEIESQLRIMNYISRYTENFNEELTTRIQSSLESYFIDYSRIRK